MSSILKVDTIQDQSGNNIINENADTITIGASGDTITIPAGATLSNLGTATGFGSIAWQSSIVTAATLTAVSGNGYWINTTSNACTITLPASAAVGDQIIFVDYARTWGTNAVTIDQNSLNFQGATTPNPIYNTDGQSVTIVYSGATQGWIPTVDDDVSLETPQPYSVDFLVIAGGGSGGTGTNTPWARLGGGGGAGGYRNSFSTEPSGGGGSSEASLTFTPGIVYTVTVGGGGASRTTLTQTGVNGTDSSISGTGISTITSIGGGGGGFANSTGDNGNSGGSGGGGGDGNTTPGSGGSGTANQGTNGGNGNATHPGDGSGGGGGAGVAGGTPTGPNPVQGGAGGNGLASSITGSSVTRTGGGASGGNLPPAGTAGGTGGTGGGGDGANDSFTATAGTINTGSGGGGGSDNALANLPSGAGGKGVVILRMADANYSGTTTGSPTVTTGVGGTDTVIVFNDSGSYTG
jgi:hypothetical protein